MTEITIHGTIQVKKNRQRIGRHGGIYKDPEVKEYEELVAKHILLSRAKHISGPFVFSGEFYISARKDLDGVVTTMLDCLQNGGLIENDKYCMEFQSVKKIPIAKGEEEKAIIRITPIEKTP